MTSHVVAIAGCITSAQAEGVVASTSGEWSCRIRRKLYYPYFWSQLSCTARTLLGTSSARWSSLVDARTGLASTADPFELERVDGDAEGVLAPRLTEDTALRIARRYVAYVGRNRRKALVVPDVKVLDRCLVHKPFWIVDGTTRRDVSFSVLVDGVTGAFHILRKRAD